MSQLNAVKRDYSPDQVYYDVTVTNFQSSNTAPPVFYYNESRTIPFINCPEDYYLSILRFTVDTGTIPVFIPSIQPNSADRDLTIYKVTIEWYNNAGTRYYGTAPIRWIPQDKSATVPPPPSTTSNGLQVNDGGYYNCYSYTYLSYLIFLAFGEAYNIITGVIPPAGGASGNAIVGPLPTYPTYFASNPGIYPVVAGNYYSVPPLPPLCQWDTTSDTLVLYATQMYDQDPLANPGISTFNPFTFYFNSALYGLFNSFPVTINGFGLGDTAFKVSTINQGGTNVQPIATPYVARNSDGQSVPYLSVYQETSTISSLSPVTAIVFCSNTMPITPNQVSTPLVFNDNLQLSFAGNNADIANIITDLVSDSGAYRPSLVYTPSAQYRLVTLNGNRPLFNLDLTIFYRLRNGSLVPFRLQSGGTVTIKIAFLKKSSVGTGSNVPLQGVAPASSVSTKVGGYGHF